MKKQYNHKLHSQTMQEHGFPTQATPIDFQKQQIIILKCNNMSNTRSKRIFVKSNKTLWIQGITNDSIKLDAGHIGRLTQNISKEKDTVSVIWSGFSKKTDCQYCDIKILNKRKNNENKQGSNKKRTKNIRKIFKRKSNKNS